MVNELPWEFTFSVVGLIDATACTLTPFSSTRPSQSLSSPSHSSDDGGPGTAPQTVPEPPGAQTFDPTLWQAPTPAVQVAPTSNPSSTAPSQSLSSPSHSSDDGDPGTASQTVPEPPGAQTFDPTL